MSLESLQAHGQSPISGVAFRKPGSGITQKLPIVKEEAPTRPSAQPEDDTSANIRSLWKAIKVRFGGNVSIKEDVKKNLVINNIETLLLTLGKNYDSAYERSLPSVWHVVATMNSGTTWIRRVDLDDLYEQLNEVKGSTLKQSTAEPTNIPKGYTRQDCLKQGANAPNYVFLTQRKFICSFFLNKASYASQTHDDEDLLQIDEDAMEEKLTLGGRGYDNCKDRKTMCILLDKDDLVILTGAIKMIDYTSISSLNGYTTQRYLLDSRVPQEVLSRRTKGSYYQGMDNRRTLNLMLLPSHRGPGKSRQKISRTILSLTVELWKYDRRQGDMHDFVKVSFGQELMFFLLSVSQICDEKHNVLFTAKECLIIREQSSSLLMKIGLS
ncbi:hypothetical protein Tco_0032845 [Tanacetum coccineum]